MVGFNVVSISLRVSFSRLWLCPQSSCWPENGDGFVVGVNACFRQLTPINSCHAVTEDSGCSLGYGVQCIYGIVPSWKCRTEGWNFRLDTIRSCGLQLDAVAAIAGPQNHRSATPSRGSGGVEACWRTGQRT